MQIPILKLVNLVMLFVSCSAFAQNITLKGKVLDAETNQPVEFANLGIVGSFMGTATDFNGVFELKVSEEFRDFTVRISAVGYRSKEIGVADLSKNDGVIVKLLPQSYGIGQVEVMAESKRLYGLLKTVGNLIADNYMKAYEAKVYYTQLVEGTEKTEVALNYVDKGGYGNRSYSDAMENRGYDVIEVRRNFKQKPMLKGLIRADDILEFDIARLRGNILDVENVDQFKLELVDDAISQKDSIWVIKYELDQPRFAETGDEQVISYSGVIYLSMIDNAVLRNELKVVSKGYHVAGRSSGLSNDSKNYTYQVNTVYRKALNGKYALGKIEYIGEGEHPVRMLWVVYDYNALKSNTDVKREYYSFKNANPGFWERFKLPE